MVAVRFDNAPTPNGRPGQASALLAGISANRTWNVVFSGLVVIGFLNGSAQRAISAMFDDVIGAVLGTYGISVIVWVAIVIAASFLWAPPDRDLSRRDLGVAMLVFLLFLTPAAPLSWVGLTLVGIYVLRNSALGSRHRRGALILLAMTVPMFWSRLAFSLVGDTLLRLDAALVALVTGAQRTGNAIAFADGWGYYWIAPPCSSIANISLAFLTYVLAAEIPDHSARLPFRYGLLAVAAVVVINVARMSITGISRAHYELMHGSIGTFLIAWLSLAAMVGICWWGARVARDA